MSDFEPDYQRIIRGEPFTRNGLSAADMEPTQQPYLVEGNETPPQHLRYPAGPWERVTFADGASWWVTVDFRKRVGMWQYRRPVANEPSGYDWQAARVGGER